MWSCAHSLSEHLMDTLVPTDLQRRLRAAWTAVVEWTSVIVSEKVRVLMASIVCFAFSRLCCGGTIETNSSDDGKSPENPVPATAVGWKSIFSVLDMARLSILGLRHEGGYIYPRGKVADQLSREDAAAAVIQRWVRTEFKRRLQNGASSRSIIDTPPQNSQGCIDEDHGAVVNTVLEDPRVSVNALRPPEAERRSGAELPSGKCPSESSDQGGDDEASLQVLEGRKRLSLSAAKLQKAVLRLKSPAEQRGTKGPISIQP
ncbi:uncharacterized protein LOC125940514 [Dermacentor silvarum]|uniref:uncharacterized protein LOC125940514 n=1 Tax=Dermacentor silvarum TaxID=543639 RepID=UPI0021009525|nr:uncharacterized protein LOC125940514 [Dermacentor silvarum]